MERPHAGRQRGGQRGLSAQRRGSQPQHHRARGGRQVRAALLLAAVLFAAPRAHAEAGRSAAAFLKRALGARAAAMGGAGTALVDPGPGAPQFNPGGLARVARPSLTSAYLNGYGGVTHGYAAYAHPLPYGVLGTGLLYFNAGDIGLNLSDGTKRTVTSEEDLAWTLSYAVPLPFGVSVGGSYRFLRMELAETASAVSHQGDAGALWRTPVKGLSLGAALQYWGPDIVFEEAGDPPPKTFRYGAALRLPDIDAAKVDPTVDLAAFDMTVAGDVVQTVFESPYQRLGVELGLTPSLMSRIALRFGWVFNRFAEGFTLGAGFKTGRYTFDFGHGDTKTMKGLTSASFTVEF
ncbi:PorV/PorQ family protein [bacterium]|nr:MAG: PorV/PorQ family protein [bacterium]